MHLGLSIGLKLEGLQHKARIPEAIRPQLFSAIVSHPRIMQANQTRRRSNHGERSKQLNLVDKAKCTLCQSACSHSHYNELGVAERKQHLDGSSTSQLLLAASSVLSEMKRRVGLPLSLWDLSVTRLWEGNASLNREHCSELKTRTGRSGCRRALKRAAWNKCGRNLAVSLSAHHWSEALHRQISSCASVSIERNEHVNSPRYHATRQSLPPPPNMIPLC